MRSTFLLTGLACLTAISASPTRVVTAELDLSRDVEVVSWPEIAGAGSYPVRKPDDLTNSERIQR